MKAITALIVEDDPNKEVLLKKELLKNGIDEGNITTAADAVNARRLLGSRTFDLLLLDLILPNRSDSLSKSAEVGIELLRQMVEDNDIPCPRVIVGTTADGLAMAQYESDFRRLTTQILYIDPLLSEWKESLRILLARIGTNEVINYNFDVCFFTALRTPELAAILELPFNWSAEESLGNGVLVRYGNAIFGGVTRRAICAHSTQMGLVAATYVSKQLITAYRPKVLLMTGVCGGIGDKPRLGDVIVAEKSWDWQSGKWLENGDFEIAPDQRDGTSELVGFARGAKDNILHYHRGFPGNRPSEAPTLHVGPLVSGSAVVANPEMHTKFIQQHRKAIGIDMECYGIYFSAFMSLAPSPKVLCIKCVSDLANRHKSDDYQEYCSYLSAKVAFDVLERNFGRFLPSP